MTEPADAVLVIAFGGPTTPEEIRPFLANVLRGRPVPPERLESVVHHYEQANWDGPAHHDHKVEHGDQDDNTTCPGSGP